MIMERSSGITVEILFPDGSEWKKSLTTTTIVRLEDLKRIMAEENTNRLPNFKSSDFSLIMNEDQELGGNGVQLLKLILVKNE